MLKVNNQDDNMTRKRIKDLLPEPQHLIPEVSERHLLPENMHRKRIKDLLPEPQHLIPEVSERHLLPENMHRGGQNIFKLMNMTKRKNMVSKVIPEPTKLLPDKNSKGPLSKRPAHYIPENSKIVPERKNLLPDKSDKIVPEVKKKRSLVPG